MFYFHAGLPDLIFITVRTFGINTGVGGNKKKACAPWPLRGSSIVQNITNATLERFEV